MYEVFNYVSPRNEDFVDEFITFLKNKAIEGRLLARFDYLEQYGPLAKPPAFEHLGEKIYYIRLSFGRLEIRILFFRWEENYSYQWFS